MTDATQNHDDDPIIAALGISPDDPDPDIPPTDRVCGYYQNQGVRFRLLHRTLSGCWMAHFQERILTQNPCTRHPGATELVLRADGDYVGELVIHCPSGGGPDSGVTKAIVSALYAAYAAPQTTPWHDW